VKKSLTGVSLVCLLAIAAPGAAQRRIPQPAAESTDQVELGRLLFWDPILSGDQDVACVTCHHPDLGYADGRQLSLGPGSVGLGPDRVDESGGRIPVVKRNSQTVLNTVYNGLTRQRGRRGFGRRGDGGQSPVFDHASAPMFWDIRIRSLEAQALEPIKALEEMRSSAYPEDEAVDSVVARLRTIPEYGRLFQDAFGDAGIDSQRLGTALAVFQRSLIATDSPVDRFRRGDRDALTDEERRGMEEFDDVGCDRCHGGPLFTDFRLHAEGVAENPLLAVPDTSRGRFRFRTPSLLNVALTAPYMHNGMLASLEDVLDFYDNGRSENPNVANRGQRRGGGGPPDVDGGFRRVDDMNDQQKADIVAFMKALTAESFDRTIPQTVPSGLQPGGRIGR
jgi:cytochrome c peroxidase